MNYSLTSVRKIDTYKQKIITNWTDAPIADNRNVFAKMQAWHVLMEDFDYPSWETGARNYKSIIATGDTAGTSNGNLGDVFMTFKFKKTLPEQMTYPSYIQVRVESDNSVDYLFNQVNDYLQNLLGLSAGSRYLYPVNIIVNMKNYSV